MHLDQEWSRRSPLLRVALPGGEHRPPVSALKEPDEFAEDRIAQRAGAGDKLRRYLRNHTRINHSLQPVEFAHVHRCAKPAVNHGLVHFQVELQAVDVVAKAERLMSTGR